VLEGTAARFAAERLESAESLAPLVDAATALDEVVRNIGGQQEEEIGRYVTFNSAFHDGLVELGRSEHLARLLANVKALPFAMPSGAILASHAVLAQSHEILVVAQHQHWQLIESIRERHGTRAEEITREHARLSRLNLDLVLENSEARDRMPGAPLLTEVA
jgi:GntR family transcriptional regulator of vanillate catabolism